MKQMQRSQLCIKYSPYLLVPLYLKTEGRLDTLEVLLIIQPSETFKNDALPA